MKKIICTLLTIISLSCITTNANEIRTLGNGSCGRWIAEREEKGTYGYSLNLYRGWILGFLTGSAVQSNKDILKNTDYDSIYLWIDNYCRANPLKHLADGSDALFEELKKQKGLK